MVNLYMIFGYLVANLKAVIVDNLQNYMVWIESDSSLICTMRKLFYLLTQ